MVSPALETLHCPPSFTLRSGVGFLLSFFADATIVRKFPHDSTWVPLHLFHHLCLFHQYRELSDPQGYEESTQLMAQTALEFSTVPFFIDNLRVEPHQVLKLISISLHHDSPLLQSKELRFPFIFGTVWKVFLQELCPEVSPSYSLFAGLHQLLHPHPPVLSIHHKKECAEGQLLCISAPKRSTYLFTLPQPCIYLIQSGPASEFSWPVPHEIFHSHRTSRCNSGSRLRCTGLHRVHHPMNRMCSLIIPSIIPPSPVCQSLCTPHFSWIKPHNLIHDYANKRFNIKELTH